MVSNFIESPLVSIITVVYNGELTLERTIKSVLNQSYKNIEYIIIDGGSNDDTLKIVNKYKKYISSFVSEKDEGIYDAMNKGISLAKGELVGIINSDDWYELDAVDNVVSSFLKYINYDVFYGVLRFFGPNGNISAIQGTSHENIRNAMISHPTCFVRRCVYEEHGIFNTKYKLASDYELILRLYLEGCKFLFIESILANFSYGGFSTIKHHEIQKDVLTIQFKYSVISLKKYLLKMIYLKVKEFFFS